MHRVFKDNKFMDNKVLATYVIVILILLIGVTYSLVRSSIALTATTTSINLAYESYFSNSDIDLLPILDNNVEVNGRNVIKIDFEVGNVENNPKDINLIYDVALTDLKIDKEIRNEYLKWKLIKNNKEIASGDFENLNDDTELTLTGTQEDLPKVSEGRDKCSFYLWFSDSCQFNDLSLCKDSVDQKDMLNKKVSGKLIVKLNTGYKTPKVISVNLNANGGSNVYSPIEVVYDGVIPDLPIPTRDQYIFLGWFSNKYKDNPLYYYIDTNKDIYNKYGYDEDALYNDYILEGKANNRRISEFVSGDYVKFTTNKTLYAGWKKK